MVENGPIEWSRRQLFRNTLTLIAGAASAHREKVPKIELGSRHPVAWVHNSALNRQRKEEFIRLGFYNHEVDLNYHHVLDKLLVVHDLNDIKNLPPDQIEARYAENTEREFAERHLNWHADFKEDKDTHKIPKRAIELYVQLMRGYPDDLRVILSGNDKEGLVAAAQANYEQNGIASDIYITVRDEDQVKKTIVFAQNMRREVPGKIGVSLKFEVAQLNHEIIPMFNDNGMESMVWVVDYPEEAQLVIAQGASAITTNNPKIASTFCL